MISRKKGKCENNKENTQTVFVPHFFFEISAEFVFDTTFEFVRKYKKERERVQYRKRSTMDFIPTVFTSNWKLYKPTNTRRPALEKSCTAAFRSQPKHALSTCDECSGVPCMVLFHGFFFLLLCDYQAKPDPSSNGK